MNDSVGFCEAGTADVAAISELAWRIWHQHYRPAILTEGELACFWSRSYTPEQLLRQMAQGVTFEWIELDSLKVGFVAYHPEVETRRLHLDKLYLDPAHHGRGVGARALRRVQHRALSAGLEEVYLYVFRNNEKAIRAYRRAGFRVERTEMTECEGGYRYDDYVMVWRAGGGQAGIE